MVAEGGFHGFETPDGPYQLFQLAMIRLNDIVEIFHLPVLGILWAFAFFLQLTDGLAIATCFVRVDFRGLFIIFTRPKSLTRDKRLAALALRVDDR